MRPVQPMRSRRHIIRRIRVFPGSKMFRELRMYDNVKSFVSTLAPGWGREVNLYEQSIFLTVLPEDGLFLKAQFFFIFSERARGTD